MEKNQRIVNSTVKMHEILLGRLSCNFLKKGTGTRTGPKMSEKAMSMSKRQTV